MRATNCSRSATRAPSTSDSRRLSASRSGAGAAGGAAFCAVPAAFDAGAEAISRREPASEKAAATAIAKAPVADRPQIASRRKPRMSISNSRSCSISN